MATTLGWLNAHAQNLTEPADKYQRLEDVSGERSMAWVNAENERSSKALDVGPVYTSLAETALKVLEPPLAGAISKNRQRPGPSSTPT
jgi:prolyl oligopeptidase